MARGRRLFGSSICPAPRDELLGEALAIKRRAVVVDQLRDDLRSRGIAVQGECQQPWMQSLHLTVETVIRTFGRI